MTNVLMAVVVTVVTNVFEVHPTLPWGSIYTLPGQAIVQGTYWQEQAREDPTRKEVRTEVWEHRVFSWEWEGSPQSKTVSVRLSSESKFYRQTNLWVECEGWERPWECLGDLGSATNIGLTVEGVVVATNLTLTTDIMWQKGEQ